MIPGVKPDHALVASIFSAAAVEAGLNLFIAAPVLFIRDDTLRRFYADFITRAARSSVRDKLRFVKRACPEIAEEPKLMDRVNKLFDYRNAALHSTPEYGEATKAVPPAVWKRARPGEPITLTDADLETRARPHLTGRGGGTEAIELAGEHYATAKIFLTLLKPVVPQRRSRPKRRKVGGNQ